MFVWLKANIISNDLYRLLHLFTYILLFILSIFINIGSVLSCPCKSRQTLLFKNIAFKKYFTFGRPFIFYDNDNNSLFN